MKGFVVILVGVAVLGAGLGGGAVAWTVLSDHGSEEPVAADFPRPTVIAAPQQESVAAPSASDVPAPDELAQLRERLRSGEATQEELAQLRQQFRGAGGFGGGFGGFTPLVGVIESIDGDIVKVETSDGVLTAILGADTTVSITTETDGDSLEAGLPVSVAGERDETGSFVASTITVVSDGGGFGGGRRPGGQRGFGGRAGGAVQGGRALFGTVGSIEKGLVTVETEQGPLSVTVNDDTIVRMTTQGVIGDLEPGMNVVIVGQPDEGGQVVARSVNVVPEGASGLPLFGGGGLAGP